MHNRNGRVGPILTELMPGRFRSVPNTGTRRRKLTATGKKPLYKRKKKKKVTKILFYV